MDRASDWGDQSPRRSRESLSVSGSMASSISLGRDGLREISEVAEDLPPLPGPLKPIVSAVDYLDSYERAVDLFNEHLLGEPIDVRLGENYYIVSMAWIAQVERKLREFKRADAQVAELVKRQSLKAKKYNAKEDFAIPINNEGLIQRMMTWGVLLKDGVRDEEHYKVVNEEGWNGLLALFGGGPEIKRTVDKDPTGRAKLDVVGVTLYFITTKDTRSYRVANFSAFTTIGKIRDVMAERFGFKPEDTRVWDLYHGELQMLLKNLDTQLLDTDVALNQLMLLEIKDEEGNWVIEEIEAPTSTRRDSRGRSMDAGSIVSTAEGNVEGGLIGLFNLRNTCYMNSTLQCLSNIPHLRNFFVSGEFEKDINEDNPLGTGGKLAFAYGELIRQMWTPSPSRAISPHFFKRVLEEFKPDYAGYMQHDSQELLSHLLDGLHEDLNRVKKKPLTAPVEANGRPDAVVAKEAYETYLKRNDSLVADLFTGMLLSKVVCPRDGCDNVSVTFDPYMMLPLPVEHTQAKTQVVACVVVPSSSPLDRSLIHVTVPCKGPLLHLRNAIAKAVSFDPESFFLAELSQGKIICVMSDSTSLETIRSDTQIYAFENPDAAKHLDMLHGEFNHWFRPTLAKSQGKLVVDENYLDFRNPPNAPRVDVNDSDELGDGTQFIRVSEDRETGTTVISINPPQVQATPLSSNNPTLTCPFEPGQVWLGGFEQKQYPRQNYPVRIEVTHVVPMGEVFRIFMLLDIHKQLPLARDRSEQEVRLLVGEYIPLEAEASYAAASREQRNVARRAGKNDKGPSSSSSTGEKKRGSFNRFRVSPRNFTRMFKGGRRKNSTSSPSSATSPSSSASSPRSPESSTTSMGGKSDDSLAVDPAESLEATSSSSSSDEEEKEKTYRDYAGRLKLEACGWKAMFSGYDDPSFVRLFKGFTCSGFVDENNKVLHGKVILDGGYSGLGHLDFFLRLSSAKQQEQAQDPELRTYIDRKLALNPCRAVRFVNKLTQSPATARRRVMNIHEPEFCLDPNILLVDKDATTGQVYKDLVSYFCKLYNNKVSSIDSKLRKKHGLPSVLDAKTCQKYMQVRRATKNYVLRPYRGDEYTGTLVEEYSSEPFFFSKHSFLRVVVLWEAENPLLQLYDLFPLPDASASQAVNMHIYDCLDLFCKEEKLSELDSWYCSKCKKHQEAVKTLHIWSLPSVLVLNFKRFSQESEQFTNKLENPVDFPLEGLDLRKYALDPESREASLYDLCAVSSHYGGLGSGHYTAYCRNEKDGKWYEFDDESVFPVQYLSSICDRSAYVLFYLRRDLRPETWGEPDLPPPSQPSS